MANGTTTKPIVDFETAFKKRPVTIVLAARQAELESQTEVRNLPSS
jgi:hypothetical protein